ncbi:ArgJ family-domain-containing protein [Lentinula aff. detonsa]|nr:ArgJ family-domain-containing protein [Lentinula aff. detonsa]
MSRLVFKRFSSTITIKSTPSKAHHHQPIPSSSFPSGFILTGLHAGVKKKAGVLDVGVILSTSERPTSAAACFTRNAFKAAPSSTTSQTLVLSTGVIAQNLPIFKILLAIRSQRDGKQQTLGNDFGSWERAAKAFMTTDTFSKLRARRFSINGVEYRMAGMDKGAGMIRPDMGPPALGPLHATLLGCIMTDAAISPRSLHFNSISVDEDMSTNDTILLLANGAAAEKNGVMLEEIDEETDKEAFEVFKKELTDFTVDLAKLVVRDGEGATKFVTVTVKGAPTYQQKEESESRDTTEREAKRRKTRDIDNDPIGGLGPKKGGIGYAGEVKEDSSGQAEAQAIQFAKDSTIRALLAEVRAYLPSLQRPGGARLSDYLPHPSSLTHLRRRSNLIASELLCNDSLADMSDRHGLYFELLGLYFELLGWLETILSHESLCSQQTVVKKSSYPTIRERKIIYEGSASPRELLEAIALQVQAALKVSRSKGLESSRAPDDLPPEPSEEQKRKAVVVIKGKPKEDKLPNSLDETVKLYSFCNRLLATTAQINRSLRELKGEDFVNRMHQSLPKAFTSASDTIYVDVGDTEEDAKEAYVKWATSGRFEYCDLTIPATELNYKHYFNNENRMLVNANIPKRSVAIAKELAILTTNLPVAWDSSIFLRVDGTRVDVIKCLITGPEGTPYHNGCRRPSYLFDVFLGASYNQSSPSVKYMTMNGGKYRFNPNRTWSGPGWVPFKLTLLQVLISIQSMILCEEPYLNEPGWASSAGTPQSKAYSANCRHTVVRIAMLDALRNHLRRLKACSIQEQMDGWLNEDDGRALVPDGAEYSGPGRDSSPSGPNGFKEDIDTPLVFLSTRAAVKTQNENKSVYKAVLEILERKGILGLYSGLSSSLLGIAVTNGVYYYFYKRFKGIYLTGGKKGSATTIISNPLWVVQTSQAVHTMNPKTRIEKLGFLQMVQHILTKDGMKGFFQGIGPALVLVVNPVIQYSVFEQLKEFPNCTLKAAT